MDNIHTQKPTEKLVTQVTETHTPQPSDMASTLSNLRFDHDTCLKMAEEAIQKGDHPPIPTGLDEATMKFMSQAESVLGTLSHMDLNIHKFMPDRSVYVKFNLDQIEAKFASLRERIVKQESLDPREMRRIALNGEYVAPVHDLAFVDTEEGIKEMLHTMVSSIAVDSESARPDEPSLSVDTEGEISLLQIFVHAAKKVYIIDFANLGDSVFTTTISADRGQETTITTLKDIFESEHILKLLWDCRGDSAMFHRFHGVTLKCVLDVQLMDLATRRGYTGKGKGKGKKRNLRDLTTVKAMGQAFHERCTEIPIHVRREWLAVKDFGKLAMNEGYETTQRLYDESGGDISVAFSILGEERLALAKSGSGSGPESESHSDNSDHTSNTSSTGSVKSTGNTNSTDSTDSATTALPSPTPSEQQQDATTPIWAFNIRPLPALLSRYASNDVTALPVMYQHHGRHATWNADVAAHVWLHSESRLREAREPGSGERLRGCENLAPEGWFEAGWLDGGKVEG